MSVNPLYEYHNIIEKSLESTIERLIAELNEAKNAVIQKEASISEAKAALYAIRGGTGELSDAEWDKFVNGDNKTGEVSSTAPAGWEPEWTWENKIKKLMETSTKPLSTSEMADKILTYEPWRERSKIVASISAILSTKSKPGGLFSKSEDLRGNYLYTLSGSAIDDFHDIINKDTTDG